jgi:hypothetical protein
VFHCPRWRVKKYSEELRQISGPKPSDPSTLPDQIRTYTIYHWIALDARVLNTKLLLV